MAAVSKRRSSKSSLAVGGRSSYYAWIVYLDSAPANWLEILQGFCLSGFVSPLHDLDIYDPREPDVSLEDRGEEVDGVVYKKPHYHVWVKFDSLKSISQALEIAKMVGASYVKQLFNPVGYAKYLCHLNSPSKAQYDPKRVISLTAEDYDSYIVLNDDELAVGNATKMLTRYIIGKRHCNYAQVWCELMELHPRLFAALTKTHASNWVALMRSYTWGLENGTFDASYVDRFAKDLELHPDFLEEFEAAALAADEEEGG